MPFIAFKTIPKEPESIRSLSKTQTNKKKRRNPEIMGCEYWQRTTAPLKDKQNSPKLSKKSDRTDELVLN